MAILTAFGCDELELIVIAEGLLSTEAFEALLAPSIPALCASPAGMRLPGRTYWSRSNTWRIRPPIPSFMPHPKGNITPLLLFLGLLLQSGCEPKKPHTPASTLLFDGFGTSRNDVYAIEKVLETRNISYDTADASELNAMSNQQLRAYRLIIFPGGNYITMGEHLNPETAQRIRTAIRNGTNYLGICAGAILAGNAKVNSLNLTSGVNFNFYAAVNRGIHKAAVPVSYPDIPPIEQYWEDGPQFSGWGKVVGKYPDEKPAIVEDTVGDGWVILCGVHPEAPQSWRTGMPFSTTAQAANDYAGTLVDAALNGRKLPSFDN